MKSFWLSVVSLKPFKNSVFATTRPHNSNYVRIDEESAVTSYRRSETNYASSLFVVHDKQGACGTPSGVVSTSGRQSQCHEHHHHQEMVKGQCGTKFGTAVSGIFVGI